MKTIFESRSDDKVFSPTSDHFRLCLPYNTSASSVTSLHLQGTAFAKAILAGPYSQIQAGIN